MASGMDMANTSGVLRVSSLGQLLLDAPKCWHWAVGLQVHVYQDEHLSLRQVLLLLVLQHQHHLPVLQGLFIAVNSHLIPAADTFLCRSMCQQVLTALELNNRMDSD